MGDLPPDVWSDAALLETIEMLAAPAEEQMAYLKEIGTYPCLDELALEFDYEYDRVRPEIGPDKTSLSPTAAEALARLDSRLIAMSCEGNSGLWKPSALAGEEWSDVRTLALTTLSAFGHKAAERPP